MKPTIAIDFDDTIAVNNVFPKAGEPIEGVKEALCQLHKKYYIVIFSCRTNSRDNPHREFHVEEMRRFLEKYQIPYGRIDEGLEGKVFAEAYIDDKAIPFRKQLG